MSPIFKKLFASILLSLSCVVLFGQTYNWNSFPTTTNSSTINFSNGNMTAVVTAVNGGGQTGYSYGSTSQIGGSGICAGTPNGLLLEMAGASMAWSNQVNVAITFTTPVCAPVTFTVYEINEATYFDGASYYSYFTDQVTIGATDQTNAAILPANIVYTGCAVAGNISTSGNNRILRSRETSDNCECNTANVSVGVSGQLIKTINLLYNNATPTYPKYGLCQYQYIVVSGLTAYQVPVTVNSSAICSGSSATLTASGGTTYLWNTGATTSSISVSPGSTTNYTVTATTSGCSSAATATVTVSSPPVVAVSPASPTICSGASTTLTAGTAVSYAWNTGPVTAAITVSPGATTTYTVTGTNPGCPGVPVSVTVNVNASPVVSAINSGNICAGGSTTLTGGGASTYSWSGGAGTGSPVTVAPFSSTTYTVTGTAVNGCTSTSQTTVSVAAVPSISASVNPGMVCAGDPVNLSSTASSTTTLFSENFESGNSLSFANSANNYWFRGSAAGAACSGTWALYITNNGSAYSYGNSTQVNHAYFDVTIPACMTSSNLSFDYKVVGNGSDYVKVWSCPTSFMPVTGVQITAGAGRVAVGASPLPGTAGVCSTINYALTPGASYRIVFSWVSNLFTLNQGPGLIDNITVTGVPTLTYSWSSNTSGFSSTLANPTDNPTVATTYTVTVTSSCGSCTNTSTANVSMCILPVELSSFVGKCVEMKKQFEWTTLSEINNNYYSLEGGNDGFNFNRLATIKGAGNSNSVKEYEYILSDSPYKYYRLKQTDFDGKFTYSDVITVDCNYSESKYSDITLYPNPVTNNLTLNFGNEINSKLHVSIKDLLGRKVKEMDYNADEITFMNITLDELNKGIYFLQIIDLTNNAEAPLQKFIKE